MVETITMPKLGFDMAEGTLVRWVIQEGEAVTKGAVLAEIETDKATVEVESTVEGILARHLVKKGDVVPVNTPIALVAAAGETLAPDVISAPVETGAAVLPPVPQALAPQATVEQGGDSDSQLPGGFKASPLARRLAQTRGIDLRQVSGTGPGGRITRRDVEAVSAVAGTLGSATTAVLPPAVRPVPALQSQTQPGAPAAGDRAIQMNRLRAAIGRRMVEAKQQVPHFYVTHEYDMAALMELRKQVNALLPENEKVSVNDFILKAAALALREFPNLNASLKGDQILWHGQVNMGVAVAVEGGLLTVVCREADVKSVRQIAFEVRAMAQRARDGKVRPDDIEGSTFSVSNLGMFDVEHFIAIINPPEAAILAVGSVREAPVVKDGQVAPGVRMKATLSVDHRVSDGVEAARFLQALGLYLEAPLRLFV